MVAYVKRQQALGIATISLAAASIASAAPETSSELNGKTIAFLPGVQGDSFYISMQCAIQKEASKYGMKVNTQAPREFNPAMQAPIVNAVASSHPAAVIIAPTDSRALVTPLKRLSADNIPIGLVDTSLDDQSLAFTSVSTDNLAAGKLAAQELAKMIHKKGKVLVIAFKAGATTSDQRQAGFEKAIRKYPNIEYLGARINDNQPAKAASIVSATLAANPDLKGIFATNQFAAQGAATGLRSHQAIGRVKIVGFDAGAVQVEQLKRGDVQALITQRPARIGHLAVVQLVHHLKNKSVKSHIDVPTAVLTRKNLDSAKGKKLIYKNSCS